MIFDSVRSGLVCDRERAKSARDVHDHRGRGSLQQRDERLADTDDPQRVRVVDALDVGGG